MKDTRFVGLDVHADPIAVAVTEPSAEVRPVGVLPNDAEAVRKLIRMLGPPDTLHACHRLATMYREMDKRVWLEKAATESKDSTTTSASASSTAEPATKRRPRSTRLAQKRCTARWA